MMCTLDHKAWKTDRAAYLEWTDFWGWQVVRLGPPVELRNCRRCHSTITDGTRRCDTPRAA